MNYVQLLNENFNEKYLNEAYWYKVTANNNDYYAYVTDPAALDELITNTSSWKKRTHNPLNNPVLDKCIVDVNIGGGYTYTISNKEPKVGDKIITSGASTFRGKGESILAPGMKAEANKTAHDEVYIHHINKQEYDNRESNIAAILYDRGSISEAHLAHKILHMVRRPEIHNGNTLVKEIPYVVTSNGVPATRTIRIEII